MKALVRSLIPFLFAIQALAEVPSAIISAVSESSEYELIYELEIPAVNEFGGDSFAIDDAYSVNNSEDGTPPFSRIAYVMELDDDWVWVSFDSYTDDLSLIGIPHVDAHPEPLQRRLSNLNIFSNVDDNARLATGKGFDGNIEFWGGNYAQANADDIPNADDATFDFGDTMAAGGHGSMQVHNFEQGNVVFAYNNWGSNNSGSPGGLGIGNSPSGNPDYTFEGNSESYAERKLYVLVKPGVPVPVEIVDAVPEAKDYELIYHVTIPEVNEWSGNAENIPYTVDNSGSGATFDRVAYLLQLDGDWVWVSFDAFTNDLVETGVPVQSVHSEAVQQILTNMNVFSNVDAARIAQGSFAEGNIEFWGGNYAQGNALSIPNASDATFDFGDTMSAGGHGSMQVHNHLESQVIFAFNNWGSNNAGVPGGLGIGNFEGENPDWTFSGSSESYETRNLWVLVRTGAPPNLSIPKLAGSAASTSGNKIALQFNEPLSASSATLANFSIEGLAVTAAAVSGDTIVLTTAAQTADATYTVTYTAVSDLEGNTILDANTADVTAPTLPTLPGTIPAAADYELIYYTEIPAAAPAWGSGVPYLVDESRFSSATSFDRVAYILELDDRWVFVSFDTIAAATELSQIGVPTIPVVAGTPIQTVVANMDVFSNNDDTDIVTTGTGLTGGNIEFWPGNYATGNDIGIPNAADGVYDFGDGGAVAGGGYGSMQIHNHEAGQVIFAFNRWGNGGGGTDIGIGNNDLGEHPDYTFAENGGEYEKRNLYVLVRPGAVGDLTPAPPVVIATVASLELNQIAVQFDQPMGASAADPANYTVEGLTITGATLNTDKNSVILATSAMQAGNSYNLVPSTAITEVAPGTQTVAAGTTIAYTAPEFPDFGEIPTSGFDLIYHLEIPEAGPFNTPGVPYSINQSLFETADFKQVAYAMVLDDEWVFASFDAHTNDINRIGIPTKSVGEFQQIVTNLSVATNVADADRVTPGNFDQGNIEFWGWNYGTTNADDIPNADGATYDWGDVRATDGGYGSLQVHNHELGQVVFAYNRWGDTTDTSDLGIGTNIDGTHPDFTFQQNVLDYEVRDLYVFAGAAAPAAVFQITDITFNETGDEVTLTWNARPGASFIAESSPDLQTWTEVGDGIEEDSLTVSVPAGTRVLYFRVEEE